MGQVLVIGLDGADFRLIDPMISSGQLPTLARLMANGARGVLRSTIRPESSLAWSSFATGKNPGGHGVFGFVRLESGTYQHRVLTARDIRSPRFWQLAGAAGKRVGVLNVPMSYPPEPVNGFLVAGMLTPSKQSEFTYPPGLAGELETATGGYVISADSGPGDRRDELARELAHCTQQRIKAIQFLGQSRAWDLFVAVFTATDRAQHFFWADMDARHPLHQAANARADAIPGLYRQIDAGLAQILADLPPDLHVFIVSDHGFNACARKFYLNAWLHQAGFLTLRPGAVLEGRLEAWLRQLRQHRALRALKRHVPGLRHRPLVRSLQHAASSKQIDWAATRAFFSQEGAIRINLRGREPEGIVANGREYDELRESLSQQLLLVRDPSTQRPPVETVYRREELYSGPYVSLAPDLIVEPHRHQESPEHNFVLAPLAADSPSRLFDSSWPYSANHSPNGILIAHGPGIRPGLEIQGARIIDVAPTLLACLGVLVPPDMDGRVLTELFQGDALAEPAASVAVHPVSCEPEPGQAGYTPGEHEQVTQRLRDLGYLG